MTRWMEVLVFVTSWTFGVTAFAGCCGGGEGVTVCQGMVHGKRDTQAPSALHSKRRVPFNVIASFLEGGPKVGMNVLEFSVVEKATGEKLKKLKVYAKIFMLSVDTWTDQPLVREIIPGHYRVRMNFGTEGTWRVTLRVITPEGKSYVQELEYDVKVVGNET